MAIFTLIGTAIAGAIGLGAATLFGVSVGSIIGGVLAFGTQLALSYLNRPKRRTYTAVQGQREYGARVPVWAVYGTCKVKGHHIYYGKWGSGNAYNADVFILSNGWCDGLEPEIYFYGQKHTLVSRPIIDNEVAHYGVSGFDDLISIRFYDGRPGQGPDTKLVSDTASLGQKWKATSICAGMAYVVVERKYDSAKFAHGIPDFDFVLRGLRLYDPRKDSTVAGGSGSHRINDPSTWEFSENPALQRLNYQLGLRGLASGRTLIGEGKSLGQLDLASYFAAMNACDALRNGKPTYRSSLLVTGDDDHTEVLKEFDDAMAGYGMNRRGLSGVIVGAPQVAVLDIGPDDIDAGRAVQIKRRKSAFELYNIIGGQFISKNAGWNPESLKPVYVNADITADGRRRQTSNDFLQVTDPDIAQYLLQIRYRQNRKGGSAVLPVSRRVGFQVEEGNWVTYAGLTWLVTGWQMDSNLNFTLTLAETGSEIYSSSGIEPGPIVVPPAPPVNPSLLTTVSGFDVEAGMITGADGYEKPVLLFTWDPPDDPTITAVRFEYGIEGETEVFTDQMFSPEDGEYTTDKNIMSGKTYVARATIVTVPDRFKQWTGWATTSTSTGYMALRAYLKDIGEDARSRWRELQAELNELRDRLEQVAAGSAEATGKDIELHTVSRRFRDATAVALREMTASIEGKRTVYRQATAPDGDLSDGDIWINTADGNKVKVWNATSSEWEDAGAKGLQTYAQDSAPTAENVGDMWVDTDDDNKLYRWSGTDWVDISDERITAQASILDAVQASVGEVSAGGLFRVEAQATSAGAQSTIGLIAEASAGAKTHSAGMLIDALSNGKSRVAIFGDQFVVIDPDGAFPPFVIEEGKAWFDEGRIRNLTAENITADKLDAAQVLQNGTLITDLMAFSSLTGWDSVTSGTNVNIEAGDNIWTECDRITLNNENPNPVLVNFNIGCMVTVGSGGSSVTGTAGIRIRSLVDGRVLRSVQASATTGGSNTSSTGNETIFDTVISQGTTEYVVEYYRRKQPLIGGPSVSGTAFWRLDLVWFRR